MPIPRMAMIYPTYVCNFGCGHCMYRNMARTQHYPYKELKSLVSQLKEFGTKGIVFCGGGEPTLYPQFKEIVEFIAKNKLDFGILTNGSMLAKYGKLLIDNARFVRVTIDSVDKDNYNRIHNPPKNHTIFTVLENIAKIVEYRDKTKSKCNIGIKSLISQSNNQEKHEMDSVFNGMGVDYVQFKYARDCVGTIDEGKTKLNCKCFMSPIQVQIDAYGDVYVCCFYQYRLQTHKFGNVLDKGFSEVWNSKEHQKAIEKLSNKECNVYDCKLHEYNNIMNEVLTKDPLHINFF